MNTRRAVVEGRFYPSTRIRIFDQIRNIEEAARYPVPRLRTGRVFGSVLPHAGHVYSGHQTVPFFLLLRRLGLFPETYVIVHPNHTGLGSAVAVDPSSRWQNSAGEVPLDREFADAMALEGDHRAHAREHSAEVLLPFMQYYMESRPFSIVPVCMGDQSYKTARQVAERIHGAELLTGRSVMVLASCDFSHFQSPRVGREQDQKVIDRILERDTSAVETVVARNRISACGYGPVMSLMHYSGLHSPQYRVKVLARGHSGEVVPSPEVVDYVSLVMYQ